MSGWWAGLAAPGGANRPHGLQAVTAAPYWSQETWERRPPATLVGLRPDTTAADVAQAMLEAHAFSVRGNLDDLERVLGRPASAVVVCGGAAGDGRLPALLAQVLGRDVHVAQGASVAARAGAVLIGRAVGAHAHLPGLPAAVLPAGDASSWDDARSSWLATVASLRSALPGSEDPP